MVTVQPENKSHGSTAVWALTPNGLSLAARICDLLPNARVFVSDAMADWHSDRDNTRAASPAHSPIARSKHTRFHRLSSALERYFLDYSSHIFLFSTGIAVRLLAPLLASKLTDPAVVVMDDTGQYAVSLLSGHLGGANELARFLSKHTGARAVITTATDSNQLPSIDLIARELDLVMENPERIKTINMAFLQGEPVQLYDPHGRISPRLPEALYRDWQAGTDGPGIFCSHESRAVSHETLRLRPRLLYVGIGCNRGTPAKVIRAFIEQRFSRAGLAVAAIATLASVDLKADETGLLQVSEQMALGIQFFSRDRLDQVSGVATPSKTVRKHIGISSVCEAAALLACSQAPDPHPTGAARERLVLSKQKNKDVTLAVAMKQ